MRPIVLLLALAACGGGGADDAADPVDAGGPLDGTYQLTWTCMSSCEWSPRPDLIQTTTLTVRGLELAYGGPGGAVHVADDLTDDCFDVPRADEPQRTRSAYQLCGDGAALEARIPWTLVGNASAFTTWRVRAAR